MQLRTDDDPLTGAIPPTSIGVAGHVIPRGKMVRPEPEADLAGQFLLGRSEAFAPPGWVIRQSAGWCLCSHPTLPVIEIRAREGALLGWVLGYPITADGVLLSAGAALPFTLNLQDGAPAFERALYSLGGRFAAIYGLPGKPRFYLDPCGSLAVVFCPEESLVTSNPMLVPYSEKTEEDHELREATGGIWWYFGLTPRRGIERLLPNHVLDLSTWQTSRHWPSAEDLAVTKDTAGAVAELAALLERHITAALRARPTYMALTAGRHTRMLLACARHHLPRLTFFTTQIHDAHGRFDLEIAQQIARRFELAHLSLPWQEPTQRDLDEWLYRTGGCVVLGRPAEAIPTLRQLDPARGILTGMAGSVGEAELWRKADLQAREVSWRADLLDRFGCPPVPAVFERAERWFRDLPTRDVVGALGLRGLEQHLGCWVAPQEYGFPRDAFVLSPYCHRRIVQLKLTLPPGYRWRDRLPDDLLKRRWPELSEIPFDKAFGMRGVPSLPKRVFQWAVRSTSPRRNGP
jgi:hypothetical protein